MAKQRSLFHGSKLQLLPAPAGDGPRFWVKRVALWADSESLIREVTLRPGLNVVWSPDPSDGPPTTPTIKALGHGGGKTLFCRLLRYCLGEDRFAPEDQRSRIADALKDGLVGAEVLVDGVPWAVVRSIGTRRRHVAIQGGSLETIAAGEGSSTGLDPFFNAIERTFIPNNVAAMMPGSPASRPWLTALAWLTRDQECRFDHVLDWRSATSGSDSPVRALSKGEVLDAIRALIRAIVPAEQALRVDIVDLERQRTAAEQEMHYHGRLGSQLRAKLAQALQLSTSDLPPVSLAAVVLRDAAQRRFAETSRSSQLESVADLNVIRAEAEDSRVAAETLSQQLAKVEAQIEGSNRLIGMINAEMPLLSFSAHEAEHPVCPVCEVPIDRALAEGCGLSHKMPDLETLRQRRSRREEELRQERNGLGALKADRQSIALQLGAARERVAQLRNQVQGLEQARDARESVWYTARRLVEEADRFAEVVDAEQAERLKLEQLQTKLEDRRAQTAAYRDNQKDVFTRLSQHFDAIIGELANEARGHVVLTGNGLELGVELDGDRSTAAIDSLKVLAFDLATLCLSIEGATCLPPFLLHDSPREADLGLAAYHQLFRFARSLETFGPSPLFQYIVTTTTQPPKEIQHDECLRLTLGGAPADVRLLRINL